MKKWSLLIAMLVLALTVAACSSDNGKKNEEPATQNNNQTQQSDNGKDKEEATNEEKKDEKNEEKNEEKSEDADKGLSADLETFIQKSAEASAKLESFSMEGTMSQSTTIEIEGQKQTIDMDIVTKSQMIRSPLQIHQTVEVVSTEGSYTTEQYIVDGSIYTQAGGVWSTLPSDFTAQTIEAMEQAASPEKQVEQFRAIADKAELREEGDFYVLEANLSGDGIKDVAGELLSQGADGTEMEAMLQTMDIKEMNIVMKVNKSDYYPVETLVKTVMEMNVEGQNIAISMEMANDYADYNSIKAFEIPQEALDAPAVGQ